MPMIDLVLFLAMSTAPVASEMHVSMADTVTVDSVYSENLNRYWKYSTYLPPGYHESKVSYPTLYLLHGSGGDETGWYDGYDMLDSLISEGAIPPVVAISPATGTSWWVDGKEPFETAFIEDLIPEIHRRYRTVATRDGRALAGFSMGGYGALRYGLAHPSLFGGAILLSPALYDEAPPAGSSARTSGAFGTPFNLALWTSQNYPYLLPSYKNSGLEVPLFIVSGDDDWHHSEGLQFDMEQQAVHLYGRVKKHYDLPAELRILDGGHSWEVWGPGFEQGLYYLFQHIRHPESVSE